MKIVEFGGQYRITIPKSIIEERKWKAGSKLKFVEDIDGNLFIKEIKK
jgi:AbrB family looped-hinge helix DNA binding protein